MRLTQFKLILVCFLLGAILAIIVDRWGATVDSLGTGESRTVTSITDPSFSPEQVVQKQLEGLRDAVRGPDGVERCYGFASPRNRAAIGTLQQFATLLRSPGYRVLSGHTNHMIGQPTYSETMDAATVLVTVVDSRQAAHAFRFWLSKQSTPPFESCWMTDGVLPIGSENRLDFPTGELQHE